MPFHASHQFVVVALSFFIFQNILFPFSAAATQVNLNWYFMYVNDQTCLKESRCSEGQACKFVLPFLFRTLVSWLVRSFPDQLVWV